jgi:endonuclease/exonuclease/phosphatase family metal-dependent hydrolase
MATEVTVKILSYNVFLRDLGNDFLGLKQAILEAGHSLGLIADPDVKFFNDARASKIGKLLAASDYDVVVFQEAFDDGARAKLNSNLTGGFKDGTPVIGRDSLGGSDGGVYMVSKWPVVDMGQIIYRDATGIDARAQKGVSWALINKEGFHFLVFGTHTQAGGAHAAIRLKQFEQFRALIDKVRLYWVPALLAGDFNVDYANAQEREDMLRTLQAKLPQDRSRHTPTSDPANELKPNSDRATTLDYVLFASDPKPAPVRPAPLRSSLETIKLRSQYGMPRWGITFNDLSDHYAVLGTYTFERKREDWRRLPGTWKSVKLNGQPDPRDWRITFDPLGRDIESVINGQMFRAIIHQIVPGIEIKGTITFWTEPLKKFETYYYSFGENGNFKDYFKPGPRFPEKKPPQYNELMLRTSNGARTTLFAFESWLPTERPDPPDRGL